MSSSIQNVCADVRKRLYAWTLISDFLDGSEAVKKAGEKYLPRPNPSDVSKENNTRYEMYKIRAIVYNATGRTHHSLVGQVFAKPVKYNLPTKLNLYKGNIDGAGVSLEQQIKQAVGYALAYGRTGLLANFTSTNGATTEQLSSGKARPVIKVYSPFDIINYRVDDNGMPVLIVLKETYQEQKTEFEVDTKPQFRVLRKKDGLVTSQIYRVDTSNEYAAAELEISLADAGGKMLDEIPFCFVGSENNDILTDSPPLYDLAELNAGHYRNSADYEESSYICGQPTPYVTGLTQQWVDGPMKGVLELGSRTVIPLPSGATAGLLQADPNTLPKEAMEHKERQMSALGAKLVEKKTVERTATEVQADEAASISILGSVTKNVESAYCKVLGYAASFIGEVAPDDILQMSTDFDISRMSAGARQQLMLEWQGGSITFSEYRDALRQAGIATLTDEEALAEMVKTPAPAIKIAEDANKAKADRQTVDGTV